MGDRCLDQRFVHSCDHSGALAAHGQANETSSSRVTRPVFHTTSHVGPGCCSGTIVSGAGAGRPASCAAEKKRFEEQRERGEEQRTRNSSFPVWTTSTSEACRLACGRDPRCGPVRQSPEDMSGLRAEAGEGDPDPLRKREGVAAGLRPNHSVNAVPGSIAATVVTAGAAAGSIAAVMAGRATFKTAAKEILEKVYTYKLPNMVLY